MTLSAIPDAQSLTRYAENHATPHDGIVTMFSVTPEEDYLGISLTPIV